MKDSVVVITDRWDDDISNERQVLSEYVKELVILENHDNLENNDKVLQADALINWRRVIDARLIKRLENCKAIARYGIGYDNVDISEASKRGIYVTNVPSYCIEEVALHTISLILSHSRQLKKYDQSMSYGQWSHFSEYPIRRFSTQTVGIVGFGNTGKLVYEYATALGANVVVSDPFLSHDQMEEFDAELVDFETLLARSDYVSIHSPLTEGTKYMFNKETFDDMKNSSFLVNVSRGKIVDEADLLDALDEGELSGAGLDVFINEPPSDGNPLLNHDSVVTTPHVAWYSQEANDERGRVAAENIRSALRGKPPRNVVNTIYPDE